MAKTTNKTSVADALKIIAEAIEKGEKIDLSTAEEKREPDMVYAIYGYNTYAPCDYNGRYITDPKAQAEYFKIYPDQKASKQFKLQNAGAPRWVVPASGEGAKKKAEEALTGLRHLAPDGRQGYTIEYRLYEMKEISA
jgi:hypothetical protein